MQASCFKASHSAGRGSRKLKELVEHQGSAYSQGTKAPSNRDLYLQEGAEQASNQGFGASAEYSLTVDLSLMPWRQFLQHFWPLSARSHLHDKSSEKHTVLLAAFEKRSHELSTGSVLLDKGYPPTYTASRSTLNAQSAIGKLD